MYLSFELRKVCCDRDQDYLGNYPSWATEICINERLSGATGVLGNITWRYDNALLVPTLAKDRCSPERALEHSLQASLSLVSHYDVFANVAVRSQAPKHKIKIG